MPQTKVRVACDSRRSAASGLNRRRGLVEMTPGLARESVGEGRSLNPKAFGDRRLGFSGIHPSAGFDDDGVGQYGGIIGFASLPVTLSASSASRGLIGSVRRGISSVQMCRIAARRVVAGVADHRGLIAENEPEGDAVRSGHLVLAGDWITPAELSVSPFHVSGPVPFPALALKSSIHLGPEAVLKPKPVLGVHRETVPQRHVVRPRKEGEVIHATD